MDVTDAFENPARFSTPQVKAVKFYAIGSKRQSMDMGRLNAVNGSNANITICNGGYAVVTFEAYVLTESGILSDTPEDDGKGYKNTATATNVVGKYYEYSGEDTDGDGKGDTVTEVTVTKDQYPDDLGDKSDDAKTPVQNPNGSETPGKPDEPQNPGNPSYTIDKTRVSEAPEKENSGKFGFKKGDTVTYEVRIANTGDLPLKMYVTDSFDPAVAAYFTTPVITTITGEDISEAGCGIGTGIARIRIEAGASATIMFEATVTNDAAENLSWTASDSGSGYLNTAKSYDVRVEKPDGTEGDKTDYPQIPDKTDEAHTPVQNPDKPGTDEPGVTPPDPTGTKPEYTMEKERTTLAPKKDTETAYGFRKGDKVAYDVTVKNSGTMDLTMDVTDAFENPELFSTPVVKRVQFYTNDNKKSMEMGKVNALNGSAVNITIHNGGYAVITYEANVLTDNENLSGTAKDDGNGYRNTASITNVVGKYYEYSGEDHDGDGKGDTVTEKTVTKNDFPDGLGDKSDDAGPEA